MNVDEFERVVSERTDLETREEVFAAADVVFRTLSDRVSRGAAAAFAEHLPDSLADAVTAAEGSEPEAFGPDAFVDRVAERERDAGALDAAQVTTHVRAVFRGIDHSVNEQAWHDLRSQLPGDYGDLYAFDRKPDMP